MNDLDIYRALKSGIAPKHITEISEYDESEVVQFLVSWHEHQMNKAISALELYELIESKSARGQQKRILDELIEGVK